MTWRHAFATLAASQGASNLELATAMGHRILEMLQRHTRLDVSSYVACKDNREVVDITELKTRITKIVARQDELRTAIDEIVADIEGTK